MNGCERERRFTAIYEAYAREVYRFVFLRTGLLPAVAEDMTQEVFLDVFRGFDRFKGLCSERTWVFKIARNKVTDHYRKNARQFTDTACMDDEKVFDRPDPKQDVQQLLEQTCDRERVLACLQSLPAQYRLVLLMKYMDGRSVKEIALIADKSCKSIDNLLQRSKAAFIKQYALLRTEDKVL